MMQVRSGIILFCMITVVIALKEGDRCSINDLTGFCALRSDCPELKKLKELGVRPKICAYTANREKIFCCPRIEPIKRITRPSEQYCEQYRKLASTAVSFGAFSLDPSTDRRVWLPACDESKPLIIGGTPASPKEFPHIAALGWFDNDTGKYDFRCGGSLISDRYVLTAGHCVVTTQNQGPPKIVRLGDENLISEEDGFSGMDYEVENHITHPSYKPSKSRYNDIALLRLNQTVQFGPTIRPACLWTSLEDPLDSKAIAIGYGKTDIGGQFSNVLLKVSLDLLDYSGCSISYIGERKLPQSIVESQICAQSDTGGKDTCHGDSGGPLQITTEGHSCLYYVVGVTSFGMSCGGTVPGVYTKVAAYLDWIEPIVWPNGEN